MTEITNIWEWYDNFYRDALWKGDVKKQQLHELRNMVSNIDANQTYESIVTPIERGLVLAKELNEPYWYVFFEYSHIRVLSNKYRVKDAIDASTRLVVEIRKPQYLGCPLLGRCYLSLISAYTSYDPVGYTQEIQDAITYVAEHFQNDAQTFVTIGLCQTEMYIALEEWHKAKASAIQYHSRSKRGFHMLMNTILLCQIAYKLRDDSLLKTQIDLGNSLLREFSELGLKTILMIWEAIWLLRQGAVESARKLRGNALELRKQANTPGGFEVETALFYYQLSESHDHISALKLVDQFVISYSPYYDCVRRLRAYYVLRQQKHIHRWIYLYVNSFDKTHFFKLTQSLPAVVRLFIYLPIGGVLNLKYHPERRAFKNVRDIAKTMRKPEFYTERIMRIEARTSYVP